MDCIVHKVAKSPTCLSDFHSFRHQLPLQASLVFTGKEYTSKSGKNLLVKNESGLFPTQTLVPKSLSVQISLKVSRKELKVRVAQSCPTLYDPMTIAYQVPLSMEILQARILEWVAMPSTKGSSQPRDQT